MPEKHLDIWRPNATGEEKIGSIAFLEEVGTLELQETATNVHLTLPSEIRLEWPTGEFLQPLLTNLRVVIFLRDSEGKIEIGIATDSEERIATKRPTSTLPAQFVWRDCLAGLIFVERKRRDSSPLFELELTGDLSYIVPCKRWFPEDMILSKDVAADVRTVCFKRVHGTVVVSYPEPTWNEMIVRAFEASTNNPLLLMQPLLPVIAGK